MINSIHGIITEKINTSLRLLTGGGIEWDITMPITDLNELPPAGENTRVFTWVHHTDTELRMFGFAREQRRSTFLEMLKVEGIGPRGAVKIMGGIGQEALENALETDDLARLEAVPGLGKKTAQKMILTLKGKLSLAPAKTSAPHGDLAEALASMGYDRRAAERALANADALLDPGIPAAEREKLLFKQAIVYLSAL
ncbi:MAG: Holliday junction branch migration protein RuvA [Spirochaetaceae bacterium]|jgi:Holliday junction DNA helicase RuvA|nr:Holliday junction branch migration protein RuvA [Spirochaetaceae bacterium]